MKQSLYDNGPLNSARELLILSPPPENDQRREGPPSIIENKIRELSHQQDFGLQKFLFWKVDYGIRKDKRKIKMKKKQSDEKNTGH